MSLLSGVALWLLGALSVQVPASIPMGSVWEGPDSGSSVHWTMDVPVLWAWPDTIVPPDTLPPPDTVQVEPEAIPELEAIPDTVPLPGEESEEEAVDPEAVTPRNLPALSRPVPPDWRTGVWEWDREALQSSRALTLGELLEQVPGIIPVRGGDMGHPMAVVAVGAGPGRVRIFADGAELAPMDGGVVDLTRVGLVGLDRVRVERRPGEVRVELVGMQMVDPRVYSLLEVGTGDLQTNMFRGTFAHPDAMGGNILLALDRVDTDGPGRAERGAAFGVHLRHTLIRSDRGGLAWSVRRMTSRRLPALYEPGDVNRSDLNLQGRYRLREYLLADAFVHRSAVASGAEDTAPDSLLMDEARTQLGLRLAMDRGVWWAESEVRLQGGPGWADEVQALRVGGMIPGWLGVSGSVERQGWEELSGTNLHGRIWTRPVAGLSFFAEGEWGSRAVPYFVAPLPPPDPPGENGEEADPPTPEPDENGEEEDPRAPPRFDESTAFRVGAEFQRGGLILGAAFLATDPDSLRPTGLPFDRRGTVLPGARRTGVEFHGRLPLTPLLDGLALTGQGQIWDEAEGWSYGPERSWDVALRYTNVFFDTRNLEIWGDVGMRGRSAMWVPEAGSEGLGLDGLARVPVNQSYYARIQARVVSARIFIQWENLSFRRDNQDIPGRILPQTRAMYGVRWTLWN